MYNLNKGCPHVSPQLSERAYEEGKRSVPFFGGGSGPGISRAHTSWQDSPTALMFSSIVHHPSLYKDQHAPLLLPCVSVKCVPFN